MRRAFYLPLFALLAAPTMASRLPGDIYKEAQLEETSARDLESAARLYREFLGQPGSNRELQAKAYLHLGLCESLLGHREPAKTAWKKIVQDYSDQSESYSEALNQLQQVQAAEQAEMRPSTPVVHIVYEPPPSRWMVELPRFAFVHTLDGKGRLTNTAAGGSGGITFFPQTNLGVTFEFGGLGVYAPPSAHREITYFSTTARIERPLLDVLSFFLKGGPDLYFWKFDNNQAKETKISLGASLEPGFFIGLPRGFTFEFGYVVHVFAQATPSDKFVSSIPVPDRPGAAEITQNRGLRAVAGPTTAISFRW